MKNDEYGILLGLFRESTSSKTIKETSDLIVKEIKFRDKVYILHESVKNHIYEWSILDNGVELTNEEIINLYAYNNLKRQMQHRF